MIKAKNITRDNKTHIGIYGRRNCGKSSLINKLANQEVAIVSDIAGTTTDPVKKSFEILDYAPVIFIDTAGIDDIGDLGEKRVSKTIETIKQIDFAILTFCGNEFGGFEEKLIKEFTRFNIPYIVVSTKSDKTNSNDETNKYIREKFKREVISFSNKNEVDCGLLINKIKESSPSNINLQKSILAGLIQKNDIVLLICPIDSEAPTGRMILPQVQLIRDILDNNCISVVLQEDQVLPYLASSYVKPKLVICDSQIFKQADILIPQDIPLTSFSTVLARHKGDFDTYLKGTPQLDKLQDGDRILIIEACSHQISCEDIGRYKLPNWIKKYTNKNIHFEMVSGQSKELLPINEYSMIIQCGACMITKKQVMNRLIMAKEAGVPISNYGLTIAYTQGIFKRATEVFVKKL